MSVKTSDKGFSSESFFVAVIKSAAIKAMPREKQESFKWFLFNAPEKVQKQFFTVLQKEEALNKKYEVDKAQFAQKLLAEYQKEAEFEDKKFAGTMRKKAEGDERDRELNKNENLLSNL